MRYRVVLDIDTTDPDQTPDDVATAVGLGVETMADYLGDAWIDLEAVEEMGT